MAKKKNNAQSQSQEENSKPVVKNLEKASSMEAEVEVEEKVNTKKELSSLKSLNAMLLKETVERRHQVDSLLVSKEFLESELSKSEMEKKKLQDELILVSDKAALIEIERGLVAEFVSIQGKERDEKDLREKVESLERELDCVVSEKNEKDLEIEVLKKRAGEAGFEIEEMKGVLIKVSKERDEIKARFDEKVEGSNGLVRKLKEVEERERNKGNEVERLKVVIMEVKEEKDREIFLISKEKNLVEGKLAESSREIVGLKKEIEALHREKKELEKKNKVGEREKQELADRVSGLNEIVASLKGEGEILRGNVLLLEEKCAEGMEKERQMGQTIEDLLEEKNDGEKILKSVIQEKSLLVNELDSTKKNLDLQMQKLEQISREKVEIEEAKIRGESEIVKLNVQLSKLKDTVLSLEKTSSGQVDKLKRLESEITHYRAALDQATSERTEANEYLKIEKANGLELRVKIAEMEKDIVEMEKVSKEMESVCANLKGEKTKLEKQCSSLTKTIASLEIQIAEAQKEHNNIKAKVGRANANSELVLNLFRNTVSSIISPSDEIIDRSIDNEKGVGEEVRPYVKELEAIKKAFEGRESKIEEMKKQIEFLEKSVAEAQKGKGFWTLISSATILAAASIAYVTRSH